MSADLVAFIEARLAEDQAAAEAVDVPDWRAESSWMSELIEPLPSQKRLYEGQFPLITEEDVRHIARHDPARVLRELPLKRRLIAGHRPQPLVDPDGKERPDWPERTCRLCDPRWMGTPAWEQGDDFVPPEPEYCEWLLLLAEIWSEHPDFREEWRPGG